MSRRPDRTPSHASHATVDSRHSSPLLLHPPSPTLTPISNPNSTTTSNQSETDASPQTPPPMDDDDGATAIVPATAPPPSRPPPSMPVREDCWLEDATHTLIEAWGDRYLELNRGNLRQKHWQEVADAVNARHGHSKKARRTDIQCKNRIDTLKKKYKIEKARVIESNSNYTSQWPFFYRLDELIGFSYRPSPTVAPHRKTQPSPSLPALPPPSSIPVGPRSKRPAPMPVPVEDSFSRRNFSAMAAAAAAAAEAEEESETSRSRSSAGSRRRDGNGVEGFRQLAEAIERFGEIYERVEEAKQRQSIELEKQRMQFAKDLEIQRMKLFMDSQIQLEKIKRGKRNSETADSYS
ncbi:hypothetical protein F0562_008508 [Nyssa sinensis]|uniref:Myb/SANT-like DNA-binding domain-containing protein n=1 Tax=Nyssa sinensis TaxID=561372 RepID=A0A5J5A7N9_9ASTE|nr:hypothetical protein F0562_008508 [Nyssa sinensis]